MGLYANGSGPGAQTVGSYTVPDQGSVSFWIRAHAIGVGTQRFVANHDDFEGLLYGSNDLVTNWRETQVNTNFGSMVAETLYHVVATYDVNASGEQVEIYVDGVLEDTGSGAQSGSISAIVQMFDRSGKNDPTDADLHDVRFYDRVLSLAEIKTIYAARGGDDIVHGLNSRWPMFGGAAGATISGTGVVKDIAAEKNDFSSATGAPEYVYDAALIPRRRSV